MKSARAKRAVAGSISCRDDQALRIPATLLILSTPSKETITGDGASRTCGRGRAEGQCAEG